MIYHYDSPLGAITYDWDGEVCHDVWLNKQTDIIGDDPVSVWLSGYFRGESSLLPPLAKASTSFQEKLRLGLLSIPPGEVRTYGSLSKQLGTSPRGLGQALGANRFPILIPCHRVLAARGLGGFAYGIAWKEKLINFEKS